MHKKIITILFLSILPWMGHSYTNPENDLIRMGKSFMTQWDFDQAIFFFSRAIEEDPGLVEAYLHRANAYLMVDKYQEAVDDYQSALVIDPEFVKSFMDSKKERVHTGSYLSESDHDPEPPID